MAELEAVAAYIGAVTGCASFIWQVIDWATRGPRIRASVNLNMALNTGGDVVIFNVSNRGDAATTLEYARVVDYARWDGWWKRNLINRVRRRMGKDVSTSLKVHLLPPVPGVPQETLPKVLEPGATWRGVFMRSPAIDEAAKAGRLYCHFGFSHRDRDLIIRV